MDTETGAWKGKKKKLVVGIVVILIVGLSAGLWYFTNSNQNITHSPDIALEINLIEQNFTATVWYIENRSVHHLTEWLDFDELGYLIMYSGHLAGSIQNIYNNQSSPYNIASGKILSIVNNTQGNETFNDNDNNGIISVNDTFYFKGDTAKKMNEAINETGWIRMYIIFNGNLGGKLVDNIFIELGCGEFQSMVKGDEE